jgi:hypothetical protein
MVETRGKQGRKVPIILMPEITNGINLLNSLRSTVGINERNPHAFAQVNRDSLEHLRGWDVWDTVLRNAVPNCRIPMLEPAPNCENVSQPSRRFFPWRKRNSTGWHDTWGMISEHIGNIIGSMNQRLRLPKSASFCIGAVNVFSCHYFGLFHFVFNEKCTSHFIGSIY